MAVALLSALALPATAAATVMVSPTTSPDGSYTVSWTDSSGGWTRAYLASSFNGGGWSQIKVTGTYSRAYVAMPVGTYAYKIRIYLYDAEFRREIFEYETNVATVVVTFTCTIGSTQPCNDGNLCTYSDRCDGTGHCVGTPISCVPAGPCQTSACNGSSRCTVTVLARGTACPALPPPAAPSCYANQVCDGVSPYCQPAE